MLSEVFNQIKHILIKVTAHSSFTYRENKCILLTIAQILLKVKIQLIFLGFIFYNVEYTYTHTSVRVYIYTQVYIRNIIKLF